jgi:hypothetical protein
LFERNVTALKPTRQLKAVEKIAEGIAAVSYVTTVAVWMVVSPVNLTPQTEICNGDAGRGLVLGKAAAVVAPRCAMREVSTVWAHR